jgi:membrane protein DedA with SNARE-associated domain
MVDGGLAATVGNASGPVAYFILFFAAAIQQELALLTATFLASVGQLQLWPSVVVVWAGVVCSDIFWYFIGNQSNKRLISRIGRYFFLKPERMEVAERFFGRHGGKTVFLARFFLGVRFMFDIAAGAAKMSFWRFLGYVLLGTTVWLGFLAVIGWYFGRRLAALGYLLEHPVWLFLAGAGVIAGIFVIYYFVSRRLWRRQVGEG